MNTSLRPMTTGEVLDRSFHLYRNHFLLFTGIAVGYSGCFLVGVFVLGSTGLFARGLDPTNIAPILLAELVLLLCSLIGYALGLGATVSAVSRVHLGNTAGVGSSYKATARLVPRFVRIVISIFLRMFGALILTEILISVFVGAVSSAILAAGNSLVGRWISIIFALGILVGGVVWAFRIFCRNSLAVAACFVEQLPARQAMKRSKWLSAGYLGRIFLVFLLTGMLSAALVYLLILPGAFLAAKVPNVALIAIQVTAIFIALTLAFPIGAIATALFYYDLRVRKEAFDLQLMMQSVGEAQPEQAAAGIR
jgi:hypothetical protein